MFAVPVYRLRRRLRVRGCMDWPGQAGAEGAVMFDTLPQIVSYLIFVLFLALAALVGVMYREDNQ